MRHFTPVVAAFALLSATAVLAQQNPPASNAPAARPSANAPVLTAPPADSLTVTAWYKQNVYDPNNNKIGQIVDVLVNKSDGKVTALVIGAGGFLGLGKHDVLVPFSAVKMVREEDRVAANDRRDNRNAADRAAEPDRTNAAQRDAADRNSTIADRNAPDRAADRNARNDRTTGSGNRRDRMAANNNYRLVMDTTKDALKNAPAVRYDRTAMTWMPDDRNNADRNQRDTSGRRNR